MSSFNAVLSFLERNSVAHRVVPVTDSSPLDARRWLRPVLVQDAAGYMLAVVPRDDFVDLELLCKTLGRELQPVFAEQRAEFLEPRGGADLFPLGALYKVTTVIQNDIPAEGPIGIVDVNDVNRIELDAAALRALQHEPSDAAIAVRATPEFVRERIERHAFARKRIEGMLGDVEGLPAMPEMSQRILQVTGDPEADANDLSRVIEVDPSLAAQIISYATSAFYGYRGDITSVRDAISRVLGFDLVANIALGISIGTSFRVTPDGPIGLSAFWRHAVYTSALAERICKAVPRDRQIKPGMAYLSGLLHDFGFLLLGHLLPDAFKTLNGAIAANPTIEVTTLEDLVVGFRHTDIGDQLLQQWKIHDEAVLAARHHHDPNYRDEFAAYTQLILVAEHLLHQHGVVSDSDWEPVPDTTLALLGLTRESIDKAAQPVIEACAGLDTLAQMLGQAA
jgi:HD-like signal output (HDOD) protein